MFIILWKSCFFWMLKVFPNSSRSIPMNAFLFTLIVGFFGLISFPRNSHPSFWKLSKTQYSCCGWRSLTKSQFKGTELLCSAYMTAEKSKDNTSRETQSRRIARLQTVCFFCFFLFLSIPKCQQNMEKWCVLWYNLLCIYKGNFSMSVLSDSQRFIIRMPRIIILELNGYG